MEGNGTEAICTIQQFSSQLKHAVLLHDLVQFQVLKVSY